MYDFIIVGGGIVGLAIAMNLVQRYPNARLATLEKETSWAAHQTGHNSGVIHSGIYYKPGSLKASLCREGSWSMVEFCRRHNIDYKVCGKVIVATHETELPRLENLYQRGVANGLNVLKIDAERVKEFEPHVRCIAAIYVPSSGIVDYRQVCLRYADTIRLRGGDLFLSTKVEQIVKTPNRWVVETNNGSYSSQYVINCAGLQSDRIAKLTGATPEAKIVPFRGEYYELKPEKRYLVKSLIYPVPNPNFPFLGVHFTRGIDGGVHAGPNAVLSFKREGYRKWDFDAKDLGEVLTYPGFWKLAMKYADVGIGEMLRSWSKAAFVRSLQRLIPEVQAEDLVPCEAGVRAQALMPTGKLVDDFLLIEDQHALHVCNAPSPAATSSLEIGKAVAARIPIPSRLETSV